MIRISAIAIISGDHQAGVLGQQVYAQLAPLRARRQCCRQAGAAVAGATAAARLAARGTRRRSLPFAAAEMTPSRCLPLRTLRRCASALSMTRGGGLELDKDSDNLATDDRPTPSLTQHESFPRAQHTLIAQKCGPTPRQSRCSTAHRQCGCQKSAFHERGAYDVLDARGRTGLMQRENTRLQAAAWHGDASGPA